MVDFPVDSVLIIETANVFVMVVLIRNAVLVFGKIEISYGGMFAEIASRPGYTTIMGHGRWYF